MKQEALRQLISILIGFAVIYLALFHSYFKPMSDGAKGFLVGIGIAIIAAPVIVTKLVHNRR
jgi:hypothetical protein